MNGAIPAHAMSVPLINPASAPTNTAPAIAGITGSPRSDISFAPITPARAATEPTDRSMPAVMITSVIPIAMIAVTAVCAPTLNKLLEVRKSGEAKDR